MGDQTDEAEAQKIVDVAKANGILEIDVAEMYPTFSKAGLTEEIVGKCIGKDHSFALATKANPVAKDGAGLTKDGLRFQLEGGLKRLGVEQVDIFYLHWPDHKVASIEETLEGVNDLYKEGKFKRFGVSNYAAWQVVEMIHICEKKGWVKPSGKKSSSKFSYFFFFFFSIFEISF